MKCDKRSSLKNKSKKVFNILNYYANRSRISRVQRGGILRRYEQYIRYIEGINLYQQKLP